MPDFIIQYYLVILIIVVFVLFAIIGYLAESVKKKEAAAKLAEGIQFPELVGTEAINIAEAEPIEGEVVEAPAAQNPSEEALTEDSNQSVEDNK